MNGTTKSTAAILLCGAIALAAIAGGCAKRNDQFGSTRTRQDMEQDTFAAGAGRGPTAATSYSFAKILISQGRDRDALYVLSHLVREHPKFLPAYNEIAGVYVRADRLDDAIAALTSGLEQAPGDGVLHNNLGMCYILQEEPEKALESFTRAAEAVPSNPTYRANRATALALSGRDAEAESEFKTVVGSLQSKQNVSVLARARQPKPEPAAANGVAPEAQAAPPGNTSDSGRAEEQAPSTQPAAPAAAAVEDSPMTEGAQSAEAGETEGGEEAEETAVVAENEEAVTAEPTQTDLDADVGAESEPSAGPEGDQISSDDRPHVSFNVLADLEVSEQSDYSVEPFKLDVLTSEHVD